MFILRTGLEKVIDHRLDVGRHVEALESAFAGVLQHLEGNLLVVRLHPFKDAGHVLVICSQVCDSVEGDGADQVLGKQLFTNEFRSALERSYWSLVAELSWRRIEQEHSPAALT